MRVVVIGAGGVGGFLAALLTRAGHDVSVLARGAHLVAIRQRGLTLRSQQFGEVTARVQAADDSSQLGKADLVIVGVKMYDFEAAAQAAARLLADKGAALTIQNGLEAPDQLAAVIGRERVLIGTASIEATIVEPGVVGHLVPIHSLTISEFEGAPTARLHALEETLRKAEINVSVVPDGRQALWNKASSLIPIATMTAAVGAGIGPIFHMRETRELFDGLMAEAGAVASAAGHPVAQAQAGFSAMMAQAAQVRPDFTTSMERDFQRGGRTELEWLTGALPRTADEHGVAVPHHRALHAVLKFKESRALAATGQPAGARA